MRSATSGGGAISPSVAMSTSCELTGTSTPSWNWAMR